MNDDIRMTTPQETTDELGEIYRRLGQIREVLATARAGDYDARVNEDLPETHPLGSLYRDLNALLTALVTERDLAARRREELDDALCTIELQRTALRELSTPIIEVWSRVLCLPVFGMVDTERSAQMMEELLRTVSERRAAYVVIDVTAVDTVDAGTLDHFIAIAKATRLLGAECVLTGIRPSVAQRLVNMGVDLDLLTTRSNLRDALGQILARRSIRP